MTEVKRAYLTSIERRFIKEWCTGKSISETQMLDFFRDYKAYFRDRVTREETVQETPVFPSRILSLDLLTGGFHGNIIQLYGPTDTFRSAFVVHAALNMGGPVIYVNSENKEFRWSAEGKEIYFFGGDYKTSDHLKEAIEINLASVIVIDSITALHRGANTLKMITKQLESRPDILLIFVNQSRYSKYTQSENTAQGSDEIHSLCSMIIRVAQRSSKTHGDSVDYVIEKGAPPGSPVKFQAFYDTNGALSNEMYLLRSAVTSGILQRSGPGYILGERRYRAREILEDQEVIELLWDKTLQHVEKERKAERNNYLGITIPNQT